jgi:aminoglycoside phosphotransferase (APT) family kinase protein
VAWPVLDAPTHAALDAAIDRLEASRDGPAVFVHGDFAPINVIVDGDGEIVALLDLEHAGVGSPLFDAAWWGWVVRHHHPDAWSAGWTTFAAAAGIDTGAGTELDIRALQVTRLLEAMAVAEDDVATARWARRLAEAATW